MLPSQSHPIVNAFAEALKGSQSGSQKEKSAFLQKVTTSLGWRNRFSQCDLYPMELSLPPDNTSVKFHVRQVQRGEIDETFGTGATVWPASVVLLKYLEYMSYRTHGTKLVIGDLGSGTGITSIGSGLLFPNSFIFCTDGEDSVVDLAMKNMNYAHSELTPSSILNKTYFEHETCGNCTRIGSSLIHVSKYRWGDGSILQHMRNIVPMGRNFDILICSDCILPKLYPISPLVDALDECMTINTVAYISYEQRYYPEYDPKDRFINFCTNKGLSVRSVPIDEQHHIYSVIDIDILEVRRLPNSSKT